MKKLIFITIISLLSLFVNYSVIASMSSSNYSISNDFVCATGSMGMTSTNYKLNDVIGNSAGAGSFSSTNYTIFVGQYDYTEHAVWYLAEGSTRHSPMKFYEWITIQNPGLTPAPVRLTFMDPDANTAMMETTIEARRRFTLDVSNYMDNRDVSTIIESLNDIPIFVERPMYWDSSDISYVGGHVTTAVSQPATTWYLAEGSTRHNPMQRYEWITIQNPNTIAANVTLTFMDTDGNTVQNTRSVKAQSRDTVRVSQFMDDRDLSTTVESDIAVIVERPMYWDGGGITYVGGHIATGVTAARKIWYLAEGSTRHEPLQRYTWITIQNPQVAATATVTLTFMDTDGNTVQTTRYIKAQSRDTVNVAQFMDDRDVSTTVESDIAIIVERPLYWDSGGITYAGGHNATGVISAGTLWNLAEGSTRDDPYSFEQWITLQNPNTSNAQVTLTFMDDSGNTAQTTRTVEGQSRATVKVASYMANKDVSTTIRSTNGVSIIVERPLYWNTGNSIYGTITYCGGHNTAAVRQE